MAVLFLLALAFMIVSGVAEKARLTAMVCLGARALIAMGSSASERGFYGAGEDGELFLRLSSEIANSGQAYEWSFSLLGGGYQGFVQGYGTVLALLGAPDDRLAAHLISIVGAALCLLLLARCWMLLLPDDIIGLKRLLVIYTFVPAIASNQSYVMREVWQSVAVLAVFYTALSWNRHGARWWHVVLGPFGVALGASLHHSLPVTMVVVGLVAIALSQRLGFSFSSVRPSRIAGAVVITAVLLVAISPVLAQSARFQEIGSGEFVERAAATVQAGENATGGARAFYGAYSDVTKPWTWPLGFGAYQIFPIPLLQGRSPIDLIAIGENALRLWLLWSWWRVRSIVEPEHRSATNYAVGIWFVIELAWSVGTINWGTGARHHVMAFSLLLLAGYSSRRSAALLADGDKTAVRPPVGPAAYVSANDLR